MFRAVVMTLAIALAAVTVEAGITVSEEMRIKDGEGKVFAVVVDCPQADPTFGGAEEGTIGTDRCGQCLVQANWGVLIRYPYDLYIKGMLVDENGDPVPNQMIQFFMPNGWVVKTRSAETGFFRILLGATDDRKTDEPLTIDIGTKKMRKGSKMEYYALFMLPEDFKPCAEQK